MPLVLAGFHVDQNLLAVLVRLLVDGIAADIGAARFDPHLAFPFSQSESLEALI